MDEQKIRQLLGIYEQLKSNILHSPMTSGQTDFMNGYTIDLVNSSIDEIFEITKVDYSKFKLPKLATGIIYAIDYRQFIGGLIGRLHAEYFSDRPEPFATSPSPSTVVSMSQHQEQSIAIQIENITKQIEKALPTTKVEAPQYNFLKTLKDNIATVRDGADLLRLVIQTGAAFRMAASEIKTLLGL